MTCNKYHEHYHSVGVLHCQCSKSLRGQRLYYKCFFQIYKQARHVNTDHLLTQMFEDKFEIV